MTKQERIKGEIILKNWAQSRKKLFDIQREITELKNGLSPFYSENLKDNFEIKKVYHNLVNEMLNEMKKRMLDFKNVETIINNLDDFEKNIIIDRYQKKYSWDKIALENHTSRTNCFNVKNRVIKKILL